MVRDGALLAVAALTILLVVLLAASHLDDRYGVGAAGGAFMGLAAAARAGVWYPAAFAHGFYGGTRYAPLPIALQALGASATGSILASAKALVLVTNVALYVVVWIILRRRGAPRALSAALIAAMLASSAGQTTTLGLRWDSLATLLQLTGLLLVAERTTPKRAALAGTAGAFALAAKLSALWGPAAVLVWLLVRDRRSAAWFAAAYVGVLAALTGLFELLSDGRMVQQLHTFAFAGSESAAATNGIHRLYQLAIRNERLLPLVLALGVAGLVVAGLRRRFGPYELAFCFLVPILIVVMRDYGAYENHLLDLEVLAGIQVAGLWTNVGGARRQQVLRLVIAACVVLATLNALRYTAIPDARRAASHELRGRADPRYAKRPLPAETAAGTCTLFEDATLPILAGQRPVVLDAFILHRLQRADRPALDDLVQRIDRRRFGTIVLDFPLTDAGWFATLDFGTALADAMRANYRLASETPDGFLYRPIRPSRRLAPCRKASLAHWG